MTVDLGEFASENVRLLKLMHVLQRLESYVSRSLTRSTASRSYTDELAFRRRRNQLFPNGYFADAGWNILLDLYVARQSGRPISTTGLGLTGGVPQTTMLRHLDKLVRDGFAVRVPDPLDGRRIFVELTAAGIERMEALFDDGSVEPGRQAEDDLAAELATFLPGVNPVTQTGAAGFTRP